MRKQFYIWFVGFFYCNGASSDDLTSFRNDEKWAPTPTVNQMLKYAAHARDDPQKEPVGCKATAEIGIDKIAPT